MVQLAGAQHLSLHEEGAPFTGAWKSKQVPSSQGEMSFPSTRRSGSNLGLHSRRQECLTPFCQSPAVFG